MRRVLWAGSIQILPCPGHSRTGMLTDIREPLHTPFGTYLPYVACVQPLLPPLDAGCDFRNVRNIHSFKLGDAELQGLGEKGFVVAPCSRVEGGRIVTCREVFDLDLGARERNIPILVTSDAMLHTVHLVFDRRSPFFTLSSLLLTQAFGRAPVGGQPALAPWEDICRPSVFPARKSDDLAHPSYLRLAYGAYGHDFLQLPPDVVADPQRLQGLLPLTQCLPGPKIAYSDQPQELRLMGQRFIPDSSVLDQVVVNGIDDPCSMPRDLDGRAALGSERAYELLQQTRDWSLYPSYRARLDSLRRELATYPPGARDQNLYGNRLSCLMPLLVPKGFGCPSWIQTSIWLDKDLHAALALWAQLQHDRVLYTEQSGTERAGRSEPKAPGTQGYVQPNVHLFARLATLARFLQERHAGRNLLFPGFRPSLETLHHLLLEVVPIPQRELKNQSLSGAQYRRILHIGLTLQQIATTRPAPLPALVEDAGTAPVVADVHTDANSGFVLEVGVGYPYAVYAICPVEGKTALARGAGFSHFEFPWPMTDRPTDETWRQMLKAGGKPAEPPRALRFLSASVRAVPSVRSARTECVREQAVGLSLPEDAVPIGDTLRAVADGVFSQASVWLEDADGSHRSGTVFRPPEDRKTEVRIATHGLAPCCGWVFVTVPAEPNPAGLSERTAWRRVSLPSAQSAGPVDDRLPERFKLAAAYPFPFTLSTAIEYRLPVAEAIRLEVVDLRGRVLRILREGRGRSWKTSRLLGRHGRARQGLASGAYLVRLQAKTEVRVRKVMLLH
ncbi:MAG: DUF3160 domain-containing protein [candidate division KSB1 bacterium]|nr:DUF3160 domain-containing protein [candidate division KSB1 bacterium]